MKFIHCAFEWPTFDYNQSVDSEKIFSTWSDFFFSIIFNRSFKVFNALESPTRAKHAFETLN